MDLDGAIFLKRGPGPMTPPIAPGDFRAKSYDVFISYRREDDAARAVLVDALEAAGYDVFWDAKFSHGDWKDAGSRADQPLQTRDLPVVSRGRQPPTKSRPSDFMPSGSRSFCPHISKTSRPCPGYFKGTNFIRSMAGPMRPGARRRLAKILGTVQLVTGGPSAKRTPIVPAGENTLSRRRRSSATFPARRTS